MSRLKPAVSFLIIMTVFMVFPNPSVAEDEEYLSNEFGFKATKAITSTGKCVLSVFFPAQKALAETAGKIGFTLKSVEFFDQLHANGWNSVKGLEYGENLAYVMSTKYKNELDAIIGPDGKCPAIGVALDCYSAGKDVYALYSSYLDRVDFVVDTIQVNPIRSSFPKDVFESAPTPCTSRRHHCPEVQGRHFMAC